ncbi:MAG: YcgN family cysteine cluster protein [Thermochromatium sp.]
MNERFWETTPLTELTAEQWESLCDGCGKCCLEKFEDEETGNIVYSRVACALLDLKTCRCRHYADRAQLMPDCITLVPQVLAWPQWLPETCAYRLLAEGRPLPDWHPLISGDPDSVVDAGQSVRGRVIGPETGEDPLMNLIDWIR